ncbi:MAG: NAD(P)/FAD-dependent oxidoreductase [Deltaproteobacteria bacterium]|nr:NAD(P)/FAD-dependent oxidoreductase [Deltaproteobacteria bacterium]
MVIERREIFQEFPGESDWDVVIIGAGPNGLMAGAYLAKAGLRVALVERRYEIGGGLVTEEILFPCYSSNAHVIYHMMVDYMPVLRDFNLDRHALVWIKPNAQTAMVFENGESLVLAQMLEDTKDSIRKHSIRDSIAFGKVMRTWERVVSDIVAPATYVPPASPLDLTLALQRSEIGREMLEITERSPLEIITDTFENERVRTIMLYTSCMWGLDPRETGIGFFVPLLLVRGMNKCYCYGGSHKFAGALAREIVQAGGTILDAAEVTGILTENGRAAGVQTAEGRLLRSKVVVSSLDPKITFLELVGAQNLPEVLKESTEGWKYDKWSFNTLHIVTDEPQRYACDDPWVDESFMTVFGFENTERLLAHWDNVISGRIDLDNFGGHATCESFFDPFLCRMPGKYVSFFQMHAPYDIEGGWEVRGEELKEAMLAKWQRAAPNLKRESIVKSVCETPVDIERRLNMRRGSIKHGDYNPTQLGYFRPNTECSGSRTPIEGLYLCGASMYPGGLVLGGNGYLAANKVAEDLGAAMWWKPTPEMERYVKTYFD